MRKPVKVFVGVVFLFILLLFCLPWQPGEVQPPRVQSAPPLHPKPIALPTAQEERAAMLNVPVETPLQAAMLWSNTYPEQAIRYAAVLDSVNAPIHFYGLCVDQDGKPLAGVTLKMGVRHWKGISPIDLRGEGRKFERISDAAGRFELSGTTGDVAGVDEAFKAGYLWIRSGSVSIDFSVRQNRIPNPANPVVLQFWKKQGAEPLYVTQPFNFQPVACNGMPVNYDLVTGAKTTQTQNPTIQFSMVRNPETLPQQKKDKFDWQFSVTLPGGGVQLAATNMPFYAPANGYEPRVTIGFGPDAADWQPQAKPTLYFRTADGHYGRMTIWILADRSGPNASFEWTSYLNPSGSPVLEYDPTKRLKPPARSPTSDLQAPAPASIPPSTLPSAALPPASNRPAPFPPQPPPGFQALTNRATPFAPPILPRP